MIHSGGVYTTFRQEEGILLPKCRTRNGRCIAILSKSIGVRGQFDSPKNWGARNAANQPLAKGEQLGIPKVGRETMPLEIYRPKGSIQIVPELEVPDCGASPI